MYVCMQIDYPQLQKLEGISFAVFARQHQTINTSKLSTHTVADNQQ